MDYMSFSFNDENEILAVKFYRSQDYDNLLEVIRNENENPLGLFKDVYLQNKERNPDFLQLTLKRIEKKKEKVLKKWMQIDYSSSQMNLEDMVNKDPDSIFYKELEKYIFQLQNSTGEKKEITVQKPNGKPTLTREQTAILFYYLREKSMIAPNPQNQHLATAIEILTGYSAKQTADILTRPERPVYQLGKDQTGVKKRDLIEVKDQLQNVIERINKDLELHKDELK